VELGLAASDLHRRGGPTTATVVAVEDGARRPHHITLDRLDVALHWVDGTAAALLGDTPLPVLVRADRDDRPRPDPPLVAMIADACTTKELFTIMHHITDELARRYAEEWPS
jgi:hypothetical protein